MPQPFTPLLTSTDWNEEWKRLQTARQRSDDAALWDEKAQTYPVKHGSHEGYVAQFLQLAGIKPGEVVLDMGCGTGALATPLAQAGHRVVACDFSGGMLAKMREDQASLGVQGVEVHQMSWADDWESFGLGADSVDVALASRSIATADLQDALLRLDRVARRRACITLPAGPSPRVDERLMRAAGLDVHVGRDFLYAFNILVANGKKPQVSYIESARAEVFASPDEALGKYAGMLRDAARGMAGEQQLAVLPERLRLWLADNLVACEGGYRLAQERIVTWAFVAWDVG